MNKYLKIIIIVIVSAIALFLGFKYVIPAFAPFIIALVLSAVMDPAVTALTKKFKIKRAISTIIIMALACILIGVIAAVAVTEVVVEVDELSKNLNTVDKSFSVLVQDVVNWASGIFDTLPKGFTDLISTNSAKITELISGLVTSVTAFFASLPSLIMLLVISLMSTFFMLKDKDILKKAVSSIYSKGKWNKTLTIVNRELSQGFVGYIKAQLTLMAITTTLAIIVLSVLQVKYAWLLGVACGILDLIPIIGPSLIYLPWAVYLVIIGNTAFAVKLIVLFMIIAVVREICSAKIIGSNLNLHPLVALMSVYVGLSLLGPAGFILGPIVVILGRSLFRALSVSRNESGKEISK